MAEKGTHVTTAVFLKLLSTPVDAHIPADNSGQRHAEEWHFLHLARWSLLRNSKEVQQSSRNHGCTLHAGITITVNDNNQTVLTLKQSKDG